MLRVLLEIILAYCCAQEEDVLNVLAVTALPYREILPRLCRSILHYRSLPSWKISEFFFALLWDEPRPSERVRLCPERYTQMRTFFRAYEEWGGETPHLRETLDGYSLYTQEKRHDTLLRVGFRYSGAGIYRTASPALRRYAFKGSRRIYLRIPYEQREAGKECEMKWDAYMRRWYVYSDSSSLDHILAHLHSPAEDDRIYLNIPFERRELVKIYGGQWDGAVRRWYVHPSNDNLSEIYHRCNTSRIFVACPFTLKDTIKTLGGQWSAAEHTWYVFKNNPHLDEIQDILRNHAILMAWDEHI